MSIVSKGGSILAKNGIIRDDSNPCKCCDECRGCRIPRVNPDQICDCIPTRYLVIVAGLNANCDCFCYSSGGCASPPGGHHLESSMNDYNGLYCFSSSPYSTTRAYRATVWDASGGGLGCGAPDAVFDFGTTVSIALSDSFGIQVDIFFTISANFNSGGAITLFSGRYQGNDCDGPWPIGNDIPDLCKYDDPPGSGVFAGGGGSAIVYACGC